MLILPCCETVRCCWGRVDFHTQAGDDAAPPEAHADANRLRDAVNMIFGMQGAHACMRASGHLLLQCMSAVVGLRVCCHVYL